MILELGIVIDCSHFSAYWLNKEIIDYARRWGWDGGPAYNNMDQIDADWDHYVKGTLPADWPEELDPDAFFFDYQEALDFAADDAVAWLNEEIARGGCYFTIDDNSLYYEEEYGLEDV